MAGYGDKGELHFVGHGFDEAGFSAAGGAFENERKVVVVGEFEEVDFVGLGYVVGLASDALPNLFL